MKNYIRVMSLFLGLILAAVLILFINGCGRQTVLTISVKGAQGVPGPQGSPGIQGISGTSIVSTTVPALSSQCPTGGNIIILAQDTENLGVWSPKDLDQTSVLVCNGLQGEPGVNGTNSTTISTVQFCSGYQSSYPGTFPEIGIVINNSIYAVYWDGHNAWLTEIMPGYYSSTSTSAPCNFTVNNDGTVSQ